MGMADFWDNITTPGFLAGAVDDFKELAKELKSIVVELVEDLDELATIGFRKMVIENQEDYQTSSEMRADGRRLINSLETICLDKRGIDSAARKVLKELDFGVEMIVDSLTEFDGAEIDLAINELQGKFKQLEFLAPDDLDLFRTKAVQLLVVPVPPTYKEPPADEQLNRVGPVGIFTSDKQKRVAAAEEYRDRIIEYQKLVELEMARQGEAGVAFDSSMLASGVGDLILRLASRYWSACCLDDRKRLSCLLLLSAGIYNPLSFETKLASEDRQPDFAEMLSELKQVDLLTNSMLTECDSLPEDKILPCINTGGFAQPV